MGLWGEWECRGKSGGLRYFRKSLWSSRERVQHPVEYGGDACGDEDNV